MQVEAERHSGLQIDHQLVFSWCLNWQVGRLLALEDAIDVALPRVGTDRPDEARRRSGRHQ